MPEITDPSVLAALNGTQPAPRPSIYRLPADPLAVRRDERADNADQRAADAAARAASNDARDAANEAARLQLERDRFAAEQARAAQAASRNAAPLTAKERADAISGYNSGTSLDRIVAQLKSQYKAGPGATSGIGGLRDYLPTEANRQFDSTANAARGIVGNALGFTGGQLNTAAEAAMAVGPYLPQSGDRDEVILDKINRLRQLAQDARTRSVAILGGTPDANGNITPIQDDRQSVFQQTYMGGGQGPGAAPRGSTEQAGQLPPAMQAELDAYIQQNGRNISEAGLANFTNGLYQKYGFNQDPEQQRAWVAGTVNALRNGGTVNTRIPAPNVPLSGLDWGRNYAVNNPVGAGFVGAANAGSLGGVSLLDRLTGGSRVEDLGNASTGNAIGMGVGEVLGSIGGTAGLGALGRGTVGRALPSLLGGGERAALARSLGTDALYSGAYGGAQGQDPLAATGVGLVGSGAGRFLGHAFGGIGKADPLTSGERAVLNAIPDNESVNQGLARGQELGLPMSLADVSPEVAGLTGAAIRRNPTVAGQARGVLQRRNLGQIDRFRSAVSDTLGPLDNVPQRVEDITAQARAKAGPLYDQAYSTPVPSSPELDSLLNTPFGRQAMARSRTIAANERRSPTELGFGVDESGNVILNPTPNDAVARHLMARDALNEAQSAYRAGRGRAGYDNAAGLSRIEQARQGLRDAEAALNAAPTPGARASAPTYTTQSLDYAKRGMDDILEEARNPITGKLNLDEMGRSQNDVRQGLLREIDRSNPAYGQARAAYAGPAGEREALYLGRQALTEQPDLLAVQVGRQTPERLDMMRLGARDRLAQGANELSNSTNPYRTINTPAMEQRLSTLYGDDATGRLLAQRDAELRMANTSNNLIGNSMTAERQAADRAFADEGFLRPIVEGGLETAVTGAPTMTVLRRLAGQRIGDALSLGLGSRAAKKAQGVADLALGLDPGVTLKRLSDLRGLDEAYAGQLAKRKRTIGGMFGRGFIPLALPIAE